MSSSSSKPSGTGGSWDARNPAGGDDTARAAALLAARLPESLGVFARLAYDFACFWRPDGRRLFAEIDSHTWKTCGHNPVRLLAETPGSQLVRAAENSELVERAEALERRLEEEHARPFAYDGSLTPRNPVAFLCAEFGIYQSLPVYSGGLGVLAGDLLKEASDSGLPMVGVGLYYRQGYFHQRIDRTGLQHEYWIDTPPHLVPLALVTDDWGIARTIRVPVRGEEVVLQIWRAKVGRTSLYLLDADRPENSLLGRWTTARLYESDREVRLAQYALLGIGGVRLMRELGIDPAVIHINEGHGSLAAFELAREEVEKGRLTPRAALAAVRERLVFTTHTPVPAGNETYSAEELWRVLPDLPEGVGLEREELLDLGRIHKGDHGEPLGLSVLALRTSRSANGVSRLHGEVARGMWQELWPERDPAEVPISHVTNGVHLPTWMAPPMRRVLDEYLGENWIHRADDPDTWIPVDKIPDEELWNARQAMRAQAVRFIRERSMTDALERGEDLARIEVRGGGMLSPEALTIGFARRLATYKRMHLLTSDPGRYSNFMLGDDPVQIVVSGKAHPLDDEGKRLLTGAAARLENADAIRHRTAFVEDYDLAVATRLVAGCDVWLNLPRPPLEASGTSGMKSMLNGGLNLSVLDGWWAEAFDGSNGWGIPADPAPSEAERDSRDAYRLFDLIENEVLPLFFDRDSSGVPRGWIQLVKASLRTNGPRFCAKRMLDDYARQVYPPND